MKDILSVEQQSWHKNLDFVKYFSYFTVKYKRENTNAKKSKRNKKILAKKIETIMQIRVFIFIFKWEVWLNN